MRSDREERGRIPRRRFLGYAAGAVMAFIGVVAGVVGLGGIVSPALKPRKAGEWVRLGRVEDFPIGELQKVDLSIQVRDGWLTTTQRKSVWVVRHRGGGFTVFNSRCTHLGCMAQWKEGDRGEAFYCPCHGGVFNINGWVIAGPPPRPLDTLNYRVEDGELYCEYMDFRLGVPEKVPI